MTTTTNDYLGGQVRITQPARGYRAGIDAVLLAAATPAKPGQSVLELGCGVGTASLCLAQRVAGISVTGAELQPEMAELARLNARQNGQDMTVYTADLSALPTELRQQSFDHVIANPPYFDREQGFASPDGARETAMGEGIALSSWVKVAAKRLKPRGYASFVHRAERLPDLLAAATGILGSIEVMPLQPRQGRASHLILVRARKEGRAPFRLHSSVILHTGDSHPGDQDHYTSQISAVLRDGAALSFPK